MESLLICTILWLDAKASLTNHWMVTHPLSNRSTIDQINYQYNYPRPPPYSYISHLWQDEGDLGILSLNREKTPQESKAWVPFPYRSLRFQITPLQRLLFAIFPLLQNMVSAIFHIFLPHPNVYSSEWLLSFPPRTLTHYWNSLVQSRVVTTLPT